MCSSVPISPLPPPPLRLMMGRMKKRKEGGVTRNKTQGVCVVCGTRGNRQTDRQSPTIHIIEQVLGIIPIYVHIREYYLQVGIYYILCKQYKHTKNKTVTHNIDLEKFWRGQPQKGRKQIILPWPPRCHLYQNFGIWVFGTSVINLYISKFEMGEGPLSRLLRSLSPCEVGS